MIYDTFVLLCKRKGLSPSRAALEAQISKSLVTKWKTNGTEVPSPEVLKKLSDFFGVTPNDLLGYETSHSEKPKQEDGTDRSVPNKGGNRMAKEFGLTDEQVEEEIERLRQSPLVALARREQRLKYRRRQFLYQLRDLEKKGAALMKAGITMEILNGLAEDDAYAEN